MERNDRLTEIVHQTLADLLTKYLIVDGFLVTITGVELSDNGNRAKVYVSVLPDKYFGTALKTLRKLSPILKGELTRRAKLRAAIKLNWVIDSTEKEAAVLEEVFKEI